MIFYNLAREYTATTGTSDCVLTGAVPGCNTWDDAGVPNGATVEYSIITYNVSTRRATGTECGSGTYTTSTKTLARTTVESSTNGGSKISLTGLSEVFITPLASDANGWGGGPGGSISFASYHSASNITTIANAGSDFAGVDTEDVDADNIASVSSDTITVAAAGWYEITAIVAMDGGVNPIGDGSVLVSALTTNTDTFIDPEQYFIFLTAAGLTFTEVLIHGFAHFTSSGTVKARVNNDSGISLDCYVAQLNIKKLS